MSYKVSFSHPSVIKGFENKYNENKSFKVVLTALSLLSIGFSISYAYLGSTGIDFPSWGGPFLITMGSLGVLSSGFLFFGFYHFSSGKNLLPLAHPTIYKEVKNKISFINKFKLTSIVLNLLGILISATYIYLGSQGSHFPSWGSNYLITIGILGSVSIMGFSFFAFLAFKNELKLLAWEENN